MVFCFFKLNLLLHVKKYTPVSKSKIFRPKSNQRTNELSTRIGHLADATHEAARIIHRYYIQNSPHAIHVRDNCCKMLEIIAIFWSCILFQHNFPSHQMNKWKNHQIIKNGSDLKWIHPWNTIYIEYHM